MKILALLFILNITQAIATPLAYNLKDALNVQDDMIKVSRELIDHDEFVTTFNQLPTQQQRLILENAKQIESIFPEIILENLLNARYIEKDKEKVKKILSFSIIYRLMLLKNTIEHPLATADQKATALKTLKNMSEEENIQAQNIFLSLSEVIDYKADILSQIIDDPLFILSLKRTPLLSTTLPPNIYQNVLLNFMGTIPANKFIKLPGQELEKTLKNLVQKATKRVFIEARTFSQIDQFDWNKKIQEIIKYSKDTVTFSILFYLPEELQLYSQWKEFQKNETTNSEKLKLYTIEQNNETPSLEQVDHPTQGLLTNRIKRRHSRGGFISIDADSKSSELILIGPQEKATNHSFFITGAFASAYILSDLKLREILGIDLKQIDHLSFENQNVTLMMAQVRHKSSPKEIKPHLVELIQNASQHIYIKTPLLYSPAVVDALLKRKIQKPQLDVRILTDHHQEVQLGGYPNSIFLQELSNADIKIRASKWQIQDSPFISVDSKVVMIGPAQLTPESFDGTTESRALLIFDNQFIQEDEQNFLKRWDDHENLYELNPNYFRYKSADSGFWSRNLSKLLNALSAQFLRALY